jgi:hypothetical protein
MHNGAMRFDFVITDPWPAISSSLDFSYFLWCHFRSNYRTVFNCLSVSLSCCRTRSSATSTLMSLMVILPDEH